MKLAVLLTVFTILQAAAASYAQRITLKVTNMPLSKAMDQVYAQSGYQVFLNGKDVAQAKVTANLLNASIEEAMDKLLDGLSLSWKLKDNTIIIKQKAAPMKLPAMTKPVEEDWQQKEVRGKVTDQAGQPVAGVTIRMKSGLNGATTDSLGNYRLPIDHANDVLTFSMVGFKVQEIPVNNRQRIDVTLEEEKSDLDEVVVVAFGTQKKKEVVGSITTITPSELKIPSSNLTTALAGRLAGVIAYQRSGEPGADNADFFIRGVTTFGYKKDPLILIDGIELTTTDLSRMQVDDIASFSILKDATSTALYGARGANGVILITTKEGVEGKAKVSLRLENSISSATNNVEFTDPITYMRLGNEAVLTRNPLGQFPYPEEKIDNTIAGTNPYVYPATDWRKTLFKDYTMNQRGNFNVTGGGKVAQYYLAATMNRDNGVLKVDKRNNFNNNIRLNTYSMRSNVTINLTNTTQVAVRLSGTFDGYNGPLDGGTGMYKKVAYSNPVLFPAYYPVDDANKFVQHIMFGNYGDGGYINPYADMVKGYKEYTRSNILAQFEVKQNLDFVTKGLSLQALFNTTRTNYFDVRRFYNPFWYTLGNYDKYTNQFTTTLLNPNGGTEYLSYSEGLKQITATTYIQGTLNYNRTFSEKHTVGALLVYLMNDQLKANAGSLQLSLPRRNLGISGRLSYGYDNRYFFEYDFGYNGTERFSKAHRFGYFPSVGAAWTISNEPFFKPWANTVTNLKIRGTYGKVGNDAIGNEDERFLYLADVNMNDATRTSVFGTDLNYGRSGIFINRYGNDQITWEEALKTNIGFELSLWNKLNILLDLYKEKRSNILMNRASIPASMGLLNNADIQANLGKASAKGFDLSVDYNQTINNDWWVQARANLTYATNKFEEYDEPDYSDTYLSHVGQPINQKWGYIAERLFADDADVKNSPPQSFGEYGAGDIKYHDVNGDGQITTRDRVPIGYPTSPEIVHGFGFSFGYKSLDVSAFFQGLSRESFWVDADSTAPFVNDRALLKVYADDHWSEQNRDLYAIWPRLSARPIANNTLISTWFMRNGAFLRLKNVEVGYTLPAKLTKRIAIEKARLYVNGMNLFLWSRFKLWDVEMGGNGLGYPLQRVINMGVQLSF
ncbi:TonB-linked outer membrane protein, SusC/RagA family [bacterium A37T11]|nr:TonB-linked outer membrane protein, SusC/RagA family [bacterium A37T11]